MTLICFAIAAYAFQHTPRGADASPNLIFIPALVVVPFFLLVSCNLQAMRFRDIGWSPAYVIPAWVLIMIADASLAYAVPSLSVGTGHHHGTIIGGLVNLVLSGALLFWPSGPETASPPRYDEPRRTRVEALGLASGAPSLPTARPAAPLQ